MAPARARADDGFDAGAKYHIAENVPYISYLKARLYQYQFHEAACRMAKWKGPLHRCSIYGNKAAGDKLQVKAGLIEGSVLDAKAVENQLASMPGKNELRAMLLATLQAPLQQFVVQLAAPAQNFAYVLAAKEREGDK